MFLQPTKYYHKKSFQSSNETPEPTTNIIYLQQASGLEGEISGKILRYLKENELKV